MLVREKTTFSLLRLQPAARPQNAGCNDPFHSLLELRCLCKTSLRLSAGVNYGFHSGKIESPGVHLHGAFSHTTAITYYCFSTISIFHGGQRPLESTAQKTQDGIRALAQESILVSPTHHKERAV